MSFELTRTGLLSLNKAELKMEETYVVEERPPVVKKPTKKPQAEDDVTNSTSNETDSEETTSTTTTTTTTTTPPPEPELIRKIKKRPINFPLSQIDKKYFGTNTLSREQV